MKINISRLSQNNIIWKDKMGFLILFGMKKCHHVRILHTQIWSANRNWDKSYWKRFWKEITIKSSKKPTKKHQQITKRRIYQLQQVNKFGSITKKVALDWSQLFCFESHDICNTEYWLCVFGVLSCQITMKFINYHWNDEHFVDKN